jgi:DNA-binding response OmpR family regulator
MAKLLLVEDDVLVSFTLADHLRSDGHQVTCSPDGVAAFNDFRTDIFDMVITDFDMPFSNGAGLVDMIRYGAHNSRVPIIIISGKVPRGVALDQIDVQGFVPKPFTIDVLTVLIDKLVSKPAAV